MVLSTNAAGDDSVFGFRIPARFATHVELVLVHLFMPHAPLLANLSGIVAGYLYASPVGPLPRLFRRVYTVFGSSLRRRAFPGQGHFATTQAEPTADVARDRANVGCFPAPQVEDIDEADLGTDEDEYEFVSREEVDAAPSAPATGSSSSGAHASRDSRLHLTEPELRRRRLERFGS
mmetsp:Transcript_12683/g.46344  ORF Transcript_12683/g.46344 Transcript_12683/m.46344 type:complete len:177 (-) Transcript_12683:1006-1536(-)